MSGGSLNYLGHKLKDDSDWYVRLTEWPGFLVILESTLNHVRNGNVEDLTEKERVAGEIALAALVNLATSLKTDADAMRRRLAALADVATVADRVGSCDDSRDALVRAAIEWMSDQLKG